MIKTSKTDKKKHYVFLRRLPKTVIWGGLEKIIHDWFKQIDYKACRVTLVVNAGWKEIFQQHFTESEIPVDIVEFPFDLLEILRKTLLVCMGFLKDSDLL